jgi:hypothetical protein
MTRSLWRLNNQPRTRGFLLLLALGAWGALAAAARPAAAVGLIYVDARSDDEDLDGVFGPGTNLSPQSAFAPVFTQDNLWGVRLGIGAEDPASPSLARYIWESGGTAAPNSAVEDSPEITQTLSGLTPSANYDVYVVFWSSNGANWMVRAGLTSGNYTLFNRTGAEGATAGTPAGTGIWTTPPTAGLAPIFTEADRTMFLGKVGTAAANAQGRIPVFVNDRPNTSDADRTWLDGLAYVPAGTAITLTATINRATGNLTLVNNTGEAVRFSSYQVTSASSALTPASWKTIQDNYVGTGPGKLDPDAWAVTAPTQPFPAFAATLSETEIGNFDGATLAAGGGTFDLGNVWARSPFENVQIQLSLVSGGTLNVIPTYQGTAIANGDFDGNGSLNLADYLTLRDHMHTDLAPLALTRIEAYKLGDLTGDNRVNYADFAAFRASYIAVNGPNGLAELMAAVPEPASAALAGVGLLAAVRGRRRRRAARPATVRPTALAPAARQYEPSQFKGATSMIRWGLTALVAGAAGLAFSMPARAQLVTGWGLETGQANATLTEGAAGAFSTTTPTGNAGPRALLATPLPFSTVGSIVQLSGTVTLQNAPGNQQFRFGLFNNNGHATGTLATGLWSGADPTGWLGYMVQIGGGNGNDSAKGRNGSGAGVWLSNTDSYIVGDGPGAQASPPAGTPYTFTLTLARTGATSVAIDYSFAGGTGAAAVNRSGSFNDTVGASTATTSFNAAGFLLNGNTGSGQFANVTAEVPKILRLRVNTTTGYVSIANKESATTFTPNYYEITSANGMLTTATWMGVDGNVPASTRSWEKAAGSSATLVSETNLLGTLPLAPGSAFAALGKLFTPGGNQDLVFRYAAPDGALQRGFVEYVTGGPAGDFDVDGDADGNDFVAWQRGVGSAFTQADLTAWKNSYHTATAATGAVPEPTTAGLLAAGLAVLLGWRRAK